jgi:hypothetical protein
MARGNRPVNKAKIITICLNKCFLNERRKLRNFVSKFIREYSNYGYD